MMQPFADSYLENSSIADNIRENDLLFPVIESVHVLAICLVVGSILVVDLRLLGFASTKWPVSRVTRAILPLTWGAFIVAVASGGLMFISNATKYLGNGFFIAKMVLIGVAGLNMVVFHFVGARDLPKWENDSRLPLSARLAGGLSILLWVAVVACGRWDRLYHAARMSRMSNCIRILPGVAAALFAACAALSPSLSEDAGLPPFRAHVDMKTFMEHVLTPAAKIVWSVNGIVIDEKGEHDLSPKSDADWEAIVSGAATLAESTNALMIPERALDPFWTFYVQKLAVAANKAYVVAEAHDLKTISQVSDQLDGICAACHRHYGVE
jgi:hypothetical protein